VASFLSNTSGFLGDWLQDVAAEQKDAGGIPPVVVPNVLEPELQGSIAGWGDVVILTPWDLYTASGDICILERQYESMTTWLDKGVKRTKDGLHGRDSFQLGDWLDPKAPPEDPTGGRTDAHFVADAYLVHVTGVLAKISRVLGREKEAQRYEADYGRLRIVWRETYVSPAGRLVAESQTGLVLTLAFELREEVHRADAAERLVQNIKKERFRVATGYIGESLSPHIHLC
jgi:alpha-L-rhamnosidase